MRRVFVYIGCVVGILCLLGTFLVKGAPQEAALAGMACAFAIIPYVLYRLESIKDAEDQRKQIIVLLKNIEQKG